MQTKCNADPHATRSLVIESLLNALSKHFTRREIKINGDVISIKCESLCSQDLNFLSWLNYICNDRIGLSVARSNKGVKVFMGVVSISEIGAPIDELNSFIGNEFNDINYPFWWVK